MFYIHILADKNLYVTGNLHVLTANTINISYITIYTIILKQEYNYTHLKKERTRKLRCILVLETILIYTYIFIITYDTIKVTISNIMKTINITILIVYNK